MIKKIKEYLTYRRNTRIAKRELAQMAAAALPVIRRISEQSTDILGFIAKLAKETKNVGGERFLELVLREISGTLQTSSGQIIEMLTYIAGLKPEDIRKLLMHSLVETLPGRDNDKA